MTTEKKTDLYLKISRDFSSGEAWSFQLTDVPFDYDRPPDASLIKAFVYIGVEWATSEEARVEADRVAQILGGHVASVQICSA